MKRPTKVPNDHERNSVLNERASPSSKGLPKQIIFTPKYRQRWTARFMLAATATFFIVYKRFGLYVPQTDAYPNAEEYGKKLREAFIGKEEHPGPVETIEFKKSKSEFSASQVLAQPLNLSAPTTKVHKQTTTGTCPHTIVTQYFQVKSKYSAEKYDEWMKNLLSLQDCIVVFTESDLVEKVFEYRQHALDKTVVVQMDIKALPISNLHNDDPNFWSNQLDIDREKRRHKSFELFWIWLSKTWLVNQAIDLNWFSSNFFMYTDIGCFRRPNYNNKVLIQHADLVPPNTVFWLAHHPPNAPPSPIWNDKFGQRQYYYHSGSQGAATASAWKEYHTAFSQMLDTFLEHNMFIGEDQCILQATCQQHSDLCAYVDFTQVHDNHYFGLRYILYYGGQYKLWRPRISGGKDSAR